MRRTLILLSLLMFGGESPSAHGCTPAPGDAWFAAVVDVARGGLPPGITVKSRLDVDPLIVFWNATDLPLEIYADEGSDLRIQPPPVAASSPSPFYVVKPGYQGSIGIRNLFRAYDERNPRADGRPANVSIPNPQHIGIRLKLGQQPYTLSATVRYQLNPGYRPDNFARGAAACAELMRPR